MEAVRGTEAPIPSIFFFWRHEMAASSVTGTGPGESHGLYKIKNNGSCGCASFPSETKRPEVRKLGCFKKYVSGGGFIRYNGGSSGLSEKSCF